MPMGRNIGKAKLISDTESGMEHAEEYTGGRAYHMLPPTMITKLLKAMKAARDGDFTIRLPVEDGLGEIAEVFNDLVGMNQSMSSEMVRVSRIVSEEGKLMERASLGAVSGSWKTKIDSINMLINAMAQPTTEVGRVITALQRGTFPRR